MKKYCTFRSENAKQIKSTFVEFTAESDEDAIEIAAQQHKIASDGFRADGWDSWSVWNSESDSEIVLRFIERIQEVKASDSESESEMDRWEDSHGETRLSGKAAENAELDEYEKYVARPAREEVIEKDIASQKTISQFGMFFENGMAEPTEAFWEQWRSDRKVIDALGWKVDKVKASLLGMTGVPQWRIFESREALKMFYAG